MRLSHRILTALLIVATSSLAAQEIGNNILLKVNETLISTNEFLWLYNKNNPESGRSNIDEYLELYTLLKLKIEEAKDQGLHLTESYKNELSSYRKQLAKGYLTDQSIKEELLQESYKRSNKEINAYHVLIRCAADASPGDTLQAWQKAMAIKERIRLGEPFMAVARGASDDPEARKNGGNLGYFTVFQTPIAFEDAVYNMKIGKLSNPVRTAHGYHIIKVQDIRPASGRVKVAHIMKVILSGNTNTQRKRAKAEIDSIYSLIQSGENFSELAIKYSDDKGSALSGGELPWFGVSKMPHEFSEVSFKLLRDGDISRPFLSIYGWHIVKRLDREAPLSYEEKRKILESEMSQSYLESISKQSFVDSLKTEYNFKLNRDNLEWFYSIADSSFRSGTYRWQDKNIPKGDLFTFASVSVSNIMFCDFISIMGKRAFSNDSIKYINTLLNLKSFDEVLQYENSILEDKYPEFAYLMSEFSDGILFFEISDKIIWSHLNGDSEGLKEYWESVKEEFMTEQSVEAEIYTIDKSYGRKKTLRLAKKIRKGLKAGAGKDAILAMGNSPNRNNIKELSESFSSGDNSIIDNIKLARGITTYRNSDGTHIVKISKVIEAEYLPYEEAIPLMIDDYQKKIELEWHKQLRDKFDVTINENTLRQIKANNR